MRSSLAHAATHGQSMRKSTSGMRCFRATSFAVPGSLVFLMAATASASLPYNPTHVFQAQTDDQSPLLYILDPPSPQFSLGQLLTIDLSQPLSTTQLPELSSFPNLPFLAADPTVAYTPAPNSDGDLMVYAGSCSAGVSSSSIWKFVRDADSAQGAGTWSKITYNMGAASMADGASGSLYLSSAITFSANTSAPDPSIYVFGGMCPDADSTVDDWMSRATYSNSMLEFDPESSSEYDFLVNSARGQPIPEAGFSATPLLPTFTNNSDGTSSQQQDFLLLGGQTQTAFINMTEVALFSLPQSSWTILTVATSAEGQDAAGGQTIAGIEPRSGHTAVLSSDGTQVIVFGGWVGDVSQPATPQLAVLNVGTGYGGSGDWEWTIPKQADWPLSTGAGIYGHGATILPGNIMLVTGGYAIPSSASSKSKRAIQQASRENFLFNVTSNTWISTYNADQTIIEMSHQESASSGALSTASQKAGFGVGLAVGIGILLLALTCGCLYWSRRKRTRRNAAYRESGLREKELGCHSEVATQDGYDDPDGTFAYQPGEVRAPSLWGQRFGGNRYAGPEIGEENDHASGGWKSAGAREAEGTALDLNLPSPQRGLRKSMVARGGGYYSTPRLDMSMHAIEELDEEHSSSTSRRQSNTGSVVHRPEMRHARVMDIFADEVGDESFANDEPDDPFMDPHSTAAAMTAHALRRVDRHIGGSSPVSPIDDEDWQEYPADGQTSPTKSERTRSDLSERSGYSTLSFSRESASQFFALAGSTPKQLKPQTAVHNNSSPAVSPTHSSNERSQSLQSRPTSSRSQHTQSDSFTTAKTGLSTLNLDAGALLAGDDSVFGDKTPRMTPKKMATEPSPTSPRFARQQSWARGSTTRIITGSVRRAVTRVLSVTSTGRTSSFTSAANRPGSINAAGYYEYASTSPWPSPRERSAASSPTKKQGRRVTDSAEILYTDAQDGSAGSTDLLGLFDDDLSRNEALSATRKAPGIRRAVSDGAAKHTGGSGREPHDGDSDSESEIHQRSVQYRTMFMVPREKLRVVNADPDEEPESERLAAIRQRRSGSATGTGEDAAGGSLLLSPAERRKRELEEEVMEDAAFKG